MFPPPPWESVRRFRCFGRLLRLARISFRLVLRLGCGLLGLAFRLVGSLGGVGALLRGVFGSEASSVASLALLEVQVVSGASDSDLDSDLLDAMALTHSPWTPLAPRGQVSRAADATASPCESEFVRVTAPTLARTPAVPSANAAPAPTKRKRTFDIQVPSRNETPSSVGKKYQAGAPTTRIELGGGVPVFITLTRGPLVVPLARALITCAAVS